MVIIQGAGSEEPQEVGLIGEGQEIRHRLADALALAEGDFQHLYRADGDGDGDALV